MPDNIWEDLRNDINAANTTFPEDVNHARLGLSIAAIPTLIQASFCAFRIIQLNK